MLLDGKALNSVVLDGADNASFSKVLTASTTSTTSFGPFRFGKLISYVSTSVVTIGKALAKAITIAETTATNIVKKVQTTKTIASTSAIVFTKQVNKTFSIVSTSTTLLFKSINKLITYASTSTASIIKAVNKIIITNVQNSAVSITRIANHLVSIIYTTVSAVSLNKTINKLISAAQSIVFTLTYGRQFFRNFTIVSTSTVSIVKRAGKLLVYAASETASLTKKVNKTLLIAVISAVGLLVQYIPLFGAVFKDTLYAPIKKRLIAKVQDTSSLVNNLKNRMISLVKNDSAIETKDLNG